MPKLLNGFGIKGDSNPGSLDCESGILPLSHRALKSQVVLLQTAHSWANAGVLLGARMHRERVAFETIKVSG